MAAVVVSPTAGVTAGLFRTEQLELSARELEGPIAGRFLEACGLPAYEVEDAEHDARLAGRALRRRGPPRGLRQPPASRGAPAQRGEHRGRVAARQLQEALNSVGHTVVGAVLHEEVAGVFELHGLGVGEQLAPLSRKTGWKTGSRMPHTSRTGHVERAEAARGSRPSAGRCGRARSAGCRAGRRACRPATSSRGRARGRPPSSAGRRRGWAIPPGIDSTNRLPPSARISPRPSVRNSRTNGGRKLGSSQAQVFMSTSRAQPVGALEHRARARSARPSRGPPASTSRRSSASISASALSTCGAASRPTGAAACPSARSPCGRRRRSDGRAALRRAIGRRQK